MIFQTLEMETTFQFTKIWKKQMNETIVLVPNIGYIRSVFVSLGLEIDETQKPHPRQCCGHDINLEFAWGRDYLGETSSLIQLYLVGKNPKKT